MTTRQLRCPSSMYDYQGEILGCVIADRPSVEHRVHVGVNRARTHILTWTDDAWMSTRNMTIGDFHTLRTFAPVPPPLPVNVRLPFLGMLLSLVLTNFADRIFGTHAYPFFMSFYPPFLAGILLLHAAHRHWRIRQEKHLRATQHQRLNGPNFHTHETPPPRP